MRNLSLYHIYLIVMFNVVGMITTLYLFVKLIIFLIAIETAEQVIKEPYIEPETLNEWLIEHHDGFIDMDSTEQAQWVSIYNEYSYLKFEQ